MSTTDPTPADSWREFVERTQQAIRDRWRVTATTTDPTPAEGLDLDACEDNLGRYALAKDARSCRDIGLALLARVRELETERDRLRDGDIAIYREAQGLRAEVDRLRGELADTDTELANVRASLEMAYLRLDGLTDPARDRQVAAATLRWVAREHLYRVVGSDGERVAVLAGPEDLVSLADRMAAGELDETGERLVKAIRERNQARLDFQALMTDRAAYARQVAAATLRMGSEWFRANWRISSECEAPGVELERLADRMAAGQLEVPDVE